MKKVSTLIAAFLTTTYLCNSIAQEMFTYSQICKAGIAVVVGKDPNIMAVGIHPVGYLLISYSRDEDGEQYAYKCKILGDRIFWGGEGGGWQDNPAEPVITWSFTGETLEIQENFSDGSMLKETFTMSQFGSD